MQTPSLEANLMPRVSLALLYSWDTRHQRWQPQRRYAQTRVILRGVTFLTSEVVSLTRVLS